MSLTEYDTDLARMDDDGWGCAITSTPEPALTAAGYLTALDDTNTATAGIITSLVQIRIPAGSTGSSFTGVVRTAVSASNGLTQFANLVPGGRYRLWRGTSEARDAEFTMPSDATDPYELPSVVGG